MLLYKSEISKGQYYQQKALEILNQGKNKLVLAF